MVTTKLVGNFGEYYSAMCFLDAGFNVDLIDSNGIDLMCYDENSDKVYGVSVKSRYVTGKVNNSLLLRDKDIKYCHDEAVLRHAAPAFAILVISEDRIDIAAITFEELLQLHGYNSYEEYDGKNVSVNISLKRRDAWRDYISEDGIIILKSMIKKD